MAPGSALWWNRCPQVGLGSKAGTFGGPAELGCGAQGLAGYLDRSSPKLCFAIPQVQGAPQGWAGSSASRGEGATF